MRQVIFELKRLQRRAHFMLMAQRLSVLLAGIGGMTLALVGLDYLLRLPGTARLVLLGSALAALGYAFLVYLRPAFRFRPGLTELALRAEEIFPAMAGHLASSVEFAESGLDRTNPLAARSVRETLSRLAGESLPSMMSPRRSVRDGAILLAVAAAMMGVTLAAPDETWTGLRRLFAPYSSARWPARTDVASLMGGLEVHPRGQALPLRARVTKGQPDHVDARYRYRVDGRFGPWQRIVLTDQGERVHERLVDTNAEAIRFYFHTDDANTQTCTIRLEEAPAIRRATLHTTPPAYASAWHHSIAVELGPGLDERAISETASLVGSEVTLSLRLNKPLPVPETPAELLRTLGWEAPGGPPALEAPERVADLWTLRWQLAGTTSLNLQLTDTFGLVNPEPIAYVIKALDDRPPSVIILEPASDEPVLASAVVGVQVEARDDVALANLAIQAGLELSTDGPAGGVTVEPAQPLSEQAEPPFWDTLQEAGEPSAMLEADLLLADHELSAGDVVLLRGVAEDVFDLDGRRHPPTVSSIRRLRIISELELAHRLRRDLGVVRQNAIRIEALQGELQEDVVDDGVGPGLERAQAKIGERIAAQREEVDKVGRRMASNRLADEQLAGLIAQVGDLLDFAGRAANRAVEAIEQRQGDLQSAPEAPPDGQPGAAASHGGISPVAEELQELRMPEPAKADRPIVDAQQEVREELADLIRLLDRDEDAWVAMRWLENLMRSQGQLESQTAGLDRQTMGRSLDELTTQEKGELGRIAERQRDLADQGRQLLKDLRDRAGELSEVDPTTASAMQDAADTGEQRELDRQMTSAAERVSQNQLHTARAAQQAAQEAMARMLENLRQTRRAGAEELLRRLASLIESIRRLVMVQENELALLSAARHRDALLGRDRGMIRLNQNTRAVAGEARTAGSETRRIARLLDRAADAQGAAVVALRAEPIDGEAANTAEERSLELLREAVELAAALAESVREMETLRQRGELLTAYRAFAERQIAVRSQALNLVSDEPLDRRRLVEARGLARSQEQIRQGLDELRASRTEVAESPVFRHVHELIDGWSRLVTDALGRGDVARRTTDRQQRIADSIGRLIEALALVAQQPEEFAGQRAGGGGSGGGTPQLVPPIAELKLIRGMQEQVYNLTRVIDGRTDLDPAARTDQLRDLGQTQQTLRDLGLQLIEELKQ